MWQPCLALYRDSAIVHYGNILSLTGCFTLRSYPLQQWTSGTLYPEDGHQLLVHLVTERLNIVEVIVIPAICAQKASLSSFCCSYIFVQKILHAIIPTYRFILNDINYKYTKRTGNIWFSLSALKFRNFQYIITLQIQEQLCLANKVENSFRQEQCLVRIPIQYLLISFFKVSSELLFTLSEGSLLQMFTTKFKEKYFALRDWKRYATVFQPLFLVEL